MDEQIIFKEKWGSYSVPYAFRDRMDLKPMEKYMYEVIRSYAGQKGYCWHGLNNLMTFFGMSKPTLLKHLKNLEEKGGLYICNRYNKTTKEQLSNRYYIININPITGQFDNEELDILKLRFPDKTIYE